MNFLSKRLWHLGHLSVFFTGEDKSLTVGVAGAEAGVAVCLTHVAGD